MLPVHHIEDMTMPDNLPTQNLSRQELKALLEVYLDYFITIT